MPRRWPADFSGDWLSYWIGYHYQERLEHLWPFAKHPHMLARGHDFFHRWGMAGAFFGRFFGPLRAVVPLVAGICGMRKLYFQLANIGSAVVWAFGLLAPGAFGHPVDSRFYRLNKTGWTFIQFALNVTVGTGYGGGNMDFSLLYGAAGGAGGGVALPAHRRSSIPETAGISSGDAGLTGTIPGIGTARAGAGAGGISAE